MKQTWNYRQGRRNYFLKIIWYSSEVYKANEKILSVKYSPDSQGYDNLNKPKLPDNFRIEDKVDNFFTSHTVLGQVIKITYYKANPKDDFFSIKEEPMFKKDKMTGDMVPMKIEDFYNDSKMVDPENEEKCPEPSGIIYCKLSGAIANNSQDFNNMVHFNNNSIRLETRDFVYDMKKDDKVWFRNMWWRIDGIQTMETTRSEQYLRYPDTKTYISLVR